MHAHDRISQTMAIGLALLAGFTDALGFMSLGGFFVSFMSGNSTRFAVEAVTRISWQHALIPLGILFVFVIGVMAGRIIRHFSTRKPSTAILIFMCAALATAALIQEAGLIAFAIPFMVIAMGAANNLFVKEGEVSIGVTYMTGTLVKFGQRLAATLLGEKQTGWLPYLLLWCGLASGAALGAVCYVFFALHSLWIGVAFCLILCAMSWRIDKPIVTIDKKAIPTHF